MWFQGSYPSPSSSSSSSSSMAGEQPVISPRVCPIRYQVEVPTLMSASDYNRISHDHQEKEYIPIMWIKELEESNKHDALKHACNSIGVTNSLDPDTTLVNGINLIESGSFNVQQETEILMHEKNRGIGYCAIPESPSAPWNEIEVAGFTLALYTFGKKLAQVKKFVGTKEMNDIQTFYYGKFYKSDAYRRWYECRKKRSRKCINGQRIFTGPRQQELFSRLLPNVSQECRNKIHKVSKKFVEGKVVLEEYVLTLRDSVGMKALVEAVGIGKGKKDLTGFTADSMKSTQAHPLRSEIPVGKDFSKLTPAEIISYLTGNFRLSKARSTDIFWEAVWPRLLDRGWHSEQLHGDKRPSSSSKQPLLFLVPGVIKFSRKLVKGNQYFDSISDVLSKVASDPGLIELETVANNDCTNKEGNGVTKETESDREISPDQQRGRYLKPRIPNVSTDVKLFTIVDTSLPGGNVRELRSLPNEVVMASTVGCGSDNEDTSEEQTNEADIVGNMCIDKGKTVSTNASKSTIGKGVSSDMNGIENNPSKKVLSTRSIGSTSTNPSGASKHKKTDLLSNAQLRDAMKSQSIQTVVPDSTNLVLPVEKRGRRSNSFSRADRNFNINSSSIFMVPGEKQEKASNPLLNSKSSENVLQNENPAKEKNMPANSNICREAVPVTSSSGFKDQYENVQLNTSMTINLNLPVSQEVGAGEPFMHSPYISSRRMSRRNGQPTIKVLEALAAGFLDPNEKRKRRVDLQDNLMPRTSRRARLQVAGETSHNDLLVPPDILSSGS